jgi:hypothetical protein|tara:strand:+ start:746 stop:937 length:192 start_codon:yes stop_codon:yes gene_type:complete
MTTKIMYDVYQYIPVYGTHGENLYVGSYRNKEDALDRKKRNYKQNITIHIQERLANDEPKKTL